MEETAFELRQKCIALRLIVRPSRREASYIRFVEKDHIIWPSTFRIYLNITVGRAQRYLYRKRIHSYKFLVACNDHGDILVCICRLQNIFNNKDAAKVLIMVLTINVLFACLKLELKKFIFRHIRSIIANIGCRLRNYESGSRVVRLYRGKVDVNRISS